MNLDRWCQAQLDGIDADHRLRELRDIEPIDATRVKWRGRSIALFSSNDYLGLSFDAEVRSALARSAEGSGLGPRGSPLICGHSTAHAALESDLAELTGQDAALVFSSGYAANLGAIEALADEDLTIFSDELNHASIIDACAAAKRAGARVEVFAHGDLVDLETRLARAKTQRRLVVTETVFSMDGDQADLIGLSALKAKYDASLMVDESHATLVFGEMGGGLGEALGVQGSIDVHVGTLSKAVGLAGGFVAGSATLMRLLLNRSRSFVFSTALPLPVVAAARVSVARGRRGAELRQRLFANVDRFAQRMKLTSSTPIFPIQVGAELRAVRLSAALFEAGYHVVGVRPPTVPRDTSRLRVTISAAHTDDQIDGLASELGKLLS